MLKFTSMDTWAIIKTGGKQYKVAEGDIISVEKVKSDGKGEISFDEVLLLKNQSNLVIGKPQVEKAKVKGKILEDYKDKKIRVIKFKPKSHYLRTYGHRQSKTKVLIEKVLA